MKKKYLLIPVFALLAFIFFLAINSYKVSAKEIQTDDFTINIGPSGDTVYPHLISNNNTDYVLHFIVDITGRKSEGADAHTFEYTNTMYFYDELNNKVEEIDPMDDINNYSTYSYSFYDGDMPTYSASNTSPIDKIYFDIEFVCTDCGTSNTQTAHFELDVAYDTDLPDYDKTNLVVPTDNQSINNFMFNISYSDVTSGIKYAKYVFAPNQPPTVGDFLYDLHSGVDFEYTEDRGNLINYEKVYRTLYLWVYLEDYAGNYQCIPFYYATTQADKTYHYDFEPSADDLIYDVSHSDIPTNDVAYKQVHIDIATSNPTYYLWKDDPFLADALSIKTEGVLLTDAGITFAPTGTGKAYLFIVSFSSETEYTSKIIPYTFDNTAPRVAASELPNPNVTRQNVDISVTFADDISEMGNVYYVVSDHIMSTSEKDSVNIPYTNGSTITVGQGLTGTYYINFLAYDALGNYYLGNIAYTFDNTPPSYNLSISEEDALDPHNEYVRVNSIDAIVFRCGWFTNPDTPLTEVVDTCATGTDIPLPTEGEGYVYLLIYLEDSVGNSVFTHSYRFLIDHVGPVITYTASGAIDEYSDSNAITISITDTYSTVNVSKYVWKPYSETGVKIPDVTNDINGTIGYPSDVYGEYALWVYATDTVGNVTFQKLDAKFLVDSESYRIALVGNDVVTILKNGEYIEKGAKAYKGNREVPYITTGVINNKQAGKYTIEYSVDDLYVTRTIIVKESNGYYIAGFAFIGLGILGSVIGVFGRKKKEI